jgi:membrane AbrB-like protein
MTAALARPDARSVALLVAAGGGGLAAEAAGVPAGAVLGALAGAVAINLRLPGPRLPRRFREAGKILLGSVVGLSFAPGVLATIGGLVVPVSVAIGLLIAVGLLLSLVLHRWFGWDLATALYACTPGGLSELAITSEDMGAQAHIVIAVHTVRVAAIVMLGPPLLTLLLSVWPGA